MFGNGHLPPQSDVPVARRSKRGWLIFLLVLIALVGGIFIGSNLEAKESSTTSQGVSAINGLDLSLFEKVYKMIKDEYVEPPQETTNLEYGAIKGLVAGLGDPNSNFMDPEETKAFQENLTGTFEGIGVELAIRESELTIVAPLSGSPAEREGIKSGDVIIAIDETDSSTITLDQAVLMIRGKGGTQVTLHITRKGEFEAKEFKITREEINIESITSEIREDGVGVISIVRFGEDTGEQMKRISDEFLAANVKGIVLDLRGNPGGFLATSVDVAGFFVENGLIVAEEFSDGTRKEYNANGNARLKDVPLVVLVDEGSASAAEILAGALQDYQRAQLVGTKTFGKGSVQELKGLDKQTSLRLTVAKFVLPKGRKIDHVGIEPDIKVEITSADIEASKDPQFDKALEVLVEVTK
jgi:carboxyl-terminal processing protease